VKGSKLLSTRLQLDCNAINPFPTCTGIKYKHVQRAFKNQNTKRLKIEVVNVLGYIIQLNLTDILFKKTSQDGISLHFFLLNLSSIFIKN
jgi:hypothetical protein